MSWIGKGPDALEPDEETRAKRSSGSGSGARLRIVLRCTFCHDALTQGEAVYCALCLAPHHHDCQRAHGRCAAPGCVCPAVVRPRSASTRQRAVRPRIPAGPRAALVNLPVLLGIVAASAGLAGSLTAVSLTVRASNQRVVIEAPRHPPAAVDPGLDPAWSRALVRLEANGFVQVVELGRGDQLCCRALRGDAGEATIVTVTGPRRSEDVLTLVPPGPVRIGIDAAGRELDQVVREDEGARFEVGWAAPASARGAPTDAREPRLVRRP